MSQKYLGRKKYDKFSLNIYLPLFLGLFLLLIIFNPSYASASSVLSGSAWWGDELQDIFFNCNDYETGSRLDDDGNFSDLPLPLGFKFFIGGCVINHQVQIDDNGNLFGSAWNHKKGMINFGGTSTPVVVPDYSFNTNCLKLCNASNNCSACYNSQTQRIYGYAQVAGGNKELIKLDSNLGVSGSPKENNLQLKSWNMASSTDLFYTGVNPGDFIGHASSTVAGARVSVSFNCLSEGGNLAGSTCAQRDYKVFLGNPAIGRMTAPNWSHTDACNPGKAKGAILRWDLKSGNQSGYEIIVTKDNIFATSSSDVVCRSGYKLGSANQYIIPNSGDELCKNSSNLDYNFSYYWFVRLWYEDGGIQVPTEWYQFGVDDGHEGSQYDINNGPPNTFRPSDKSKTFTTYKHEFPVPYFTWSPETIEVGATSTIFTALDPSHKSKYYSVSSPSNPIDCAVSGNCGYSWSSVGADSTIYSLNSASTTIVFNQPGSATVNLDIVDQSGYQCRYSKLITDINYGLPIWREVKAE